MYTREQEGLTDEEVLQDGNQKPIETLLIFLTVFISSITFFTSPFEGYFHYLIFALYFPFFFMRFGFPKIPFQLLFLPLVFGVLHIFLGNNSAALFWKIFLGIFLSTSFYFYVILYYEMNIDRLFRFYLRGCYLVCIIGLVQWVSYKIGFAPGYDYTWLFNKWGLVPSGNGGLRVNSVFAEPSQFATVIIPAVFVSFYSLFTQTIKYQNHYKSILIIFMSIMTTASTGYIGIFIILILLTMNYGHFVNFIGGIGAAILLGFIIYSYVPEFHSRIDSAIGLWVDEDLSVNNVNSSSFVLYNNLHVATENFKNNPLTGTGLGSHSFAFEKYSLTKNKGVLKFTFNKSDANSMLLRLISETGLMGVGFVLLVIFRFYIRRDPDEEDDR
jgi:hypothetical protein